MRIVRTGQATLEPATGALYTDGIGFAVMAGAPDTTEVEVYRVDFAPGARNRVHIHTRDQVLIGHIGTGIVADATGEHPLAPGDVVTIPAGHPHWHGAGPDEPFSHLTVAVPGDTIEIVDTEARGLWGALPETDDG